MFDKNGLAIITSFYLWLELLYFSCLLFGLHVFGGVVKKMFTYFHNMYIFVST